MGKNVENPLFSPPELATLTATIMHARSGPPVDVQGWCGGRPGPSQVKVLLLGQGQAIK